MDKKRLDEPDYFIRLDAFKKLNAIVRDLQEFDEKVALLLIYNCCYFINNVNLDFDIFGIFFLCL